VYDEVLDHKVQEEDFIITPIQEVSQDVVEDETEEEQITLTFDLPLSFGKEDQEIEIPEVEEKTVFELDDEEVKDLNVKK